MTTPVETVIIPQPIALAMLDWHDGQDTALYGAGSLANAGRPVPRKLARAAYKELDGCLDMGDPIARRTLRLAITGLRAALYGSDGGIMMILTGEAPRDA